MKIQIKILLGLILLVIGVFLYSYKFPNIKTQNEVVPNEIVPTETISKPNNSNTKSVSFGNVVYTVIPENLTSSQKSRNFKIILDTHNGSLDQDLVQIIRLADDQNNEFRAIKWEGDPPGGHHRSGVLQFQPSDTNSKSVTLKIKEQDNPEEKSLTWDILN